MLNKTFPSFLRQREREMFYLTTYSTHFIYGYMASDIWLRTILIVRKETRCCHIGYSYRLTARVLLYAPSHRQDNTYHGLCYTSCGALGGMRNSSMGPPHEGSTSELRPARFQYRSAFVWVLEVSVNCCFVFDSAYNCVALCLIQRTTVTRTTLPAPTTRRASPAPGSVTATRTARTAPTRSAAVSDSTACYPILKLRRLDWLST